MRERENTRLDDYLIFARSLPLFFLYFQLTNNYVCRETKDERILCMSKLSVEHEVRSCSH